MKKQPSFLLCLGIVVLLLVSVQCQQGVEPETAETTPLAHTPTVTTTPAAMTTQTPVSQATLAAPTGPTAVPTTQTGVAETADLPAGALVQVSLNSQVGVLLDELPAPMREQLVAELLNQPESFWLERAHLQVQMTMYRLNFRNFVYEGKGQLPLPPQALWSFVLDPAGPTRQEIQGHDLVTIGYSFSSTILTDAASPGTAEPALAEIGGTWQEPFILPVDPELLLQRTGNACLNEAGFPPNSYDSENAWIFFDYACTADSGGVNGCHRLQLPTLSCLEALETRIGTHQTQMNFERLPWNDTLADQVRLGPVSQQGAPDLQVLQEDLSNFRLIYRYFPSDSCALVEQCVGGPGWRRLLQFDATVYNIGDAPLHIGRVAEDSSNFMFQYNACHNHFHFGNYGEFTFNDSTEFLTSKQAFCVESTERLSNNETSPLIHTYSCSFQGIQAGWIDEYQAGLDCQWIDVTNYAATEPISVTLGFDSNTAEFLCEGKPVLDEQGNVQWEPSGLTTASGAIINRPQCDFVPDWNLNNSGSVQLNIPPDGGFVTAPCSRNQWGPLRNCGFTEQEDGLSCIPGIQVKLSCTVPETAEPQIVRVCESSAVLGTGVACVYEEVLVNRTIGDGGGETTASLTFTCPFPRDTNEPGGLYALYTAPLLPGGVTQPVACEVVQP